MTDALGGAPQYNWIQDLKTINNFTTSLSLKFAVLLHQMGQVNRNPQAEDQIRWKLTASGQYTTSSAYTTQFIGSTSTPHIIARHAPYVATLWKRHTNSVQSVAT